MLPSTRLSYKRYLNFCFIFFFYFLITNFQWKQKTIINMHLFLAFFAYIYIHWWFNEISPSSLFRNKSSLTILCVCVCVCVLSRFIHAQLLETLWTVAHQALPSMGFSRQEYLGRLPFPAPGDLTDPGSNPPVLYFLHSFICDFNYHNTKDVLESNFHNYHLNTGFYYLNVTNTFNNIRQKLFCFI